MGCETSNCQLTSKEEEFKQEKKQKPITFLYSIIEDKTDLQISKKREYLLCKDDSRPPKHGFVSLNQYKAKTINENENEAIHGKFDESMLNLFVNRPQKNVFFNQYYVDTATEMSYNNQYNTEGLATLDGKCSQILCNSEQITVIDFWRSW